MIILKTERELSYMRSAGRIAANALQLAGENIKPGISTLELDEIVEKYIRKNGATPSFLNYGGFPASACISPNNVVVHGIPSKNCILKEGDIVTIDVGACYKGYHGDTAYTFACGEISKEAQKLLEVTKESRKRGIEKAKKGFRIGDISSAVQEYVESHNYSVVRDFVGHGVGARLHEEPSVPNFGKKGRGVRLIPHMTIAIEPMVNIGSYYVDVLEDEWTTVTRDGSLSAQFEHTVAITEDEPVILTLPG
ncbi:MAG: type I methionyl aminopeptidase [Clostridia bacterium]|nr:type I methionyl aminopeptidase [Clostridia bacterium]